MKSHKNNNTKQLLIDTAYEIIQESGFRSLTVRAISNRANVNTGSFVYHFKSKESFADELIEKWYAPFFNNMKLSHSQEENAFESLRSMCVQTVGFVFENRSLICQLIEDVAAKEVSVCKFMKSLYNRHPVLLIESVLRAQKEKLICDKEPVSLLMYIFGASAAPVLIQTLFQKNNKATVLAELFSSQDMLDYTTRINWALKSIQLDSSSRN